MFKLDWMNLMSVVHITIFHVYVFMFYVFMFYPSIMIFCYIKYIMNIVGNRCENIVEIETQDDWVGIKLWNASY